MADDTVSVIDQLLAGQPNTKPVDTSKVTRTDGSGSVAERQRMVVSDDLFSDAKVKITADGLLRADPVNEPTIVFLLMAILNQLNNIGRALSAPETILPDNRIN